MSIQEANAVELALSCEVLGNVVDPKLIESFVLKVSIDEITSDSNVDFLTIPAFDGKAVDSIATHDFLHGWFGSTDAKAHGEVRHELFWIHRYFVIVQGRA